MTDDARRELIKRLQEKEFSSEDPRTASLVGEPLSFENRRKIYEMQLRQKEAIAAEQMRAQEALKEYWTVPKNLKAKLEHFIDVFCREWGEERREKLEGSLAIVEGEGGVVLTENDGRHRHVDVDMPHLPIYLSGAFLSEAKEQFLRRWNDL